MNPNDFIEQHAGLDLTDDASELLDSAEFRTALLRVLHRQPSPDNVALLRALLEREIQCRRANEAGEAFENLYWSAFLLSRQADLADVPALWAAKNIDFDTACGFDVQFLVGAGVEETLAFLRSRSDDDSHAALNYLLKAREAGDFDGLDEWARWRDEYFGSD